MRVYIYVLSALLCLAAGIAAQPTAYVVNTSGETLSRINLDDGTVDNNFITVGSDVFSFPNQIVVRDNRAYVVASGTNEVHVIDIEADTTVGFINTGIGSNPYWMAFLNDAFAYVTNLVTNEVVKVDVPGLAVVDTIPVGVGPAGIVIYDSRAYVAHTAFDFNTFTYGQGTVWVIDTDGDSVVSIIDVGTNPQYLATDRDGEIQVVCTGDFASEFGIVYTIDPAIDAVVDSFTVGGSPGQISIGPNNFAYLAAGGFEPSGNGFVYNFDASTNQVLHDASNPIVVDSGCLTAVVFQDAACYTGAFEDSVKPIDSQGTILNSYAVGDGPVHIDFNYVPGDINGDWSTDIADLTYLVAFQFKNGPGPVWPVWRGNINGTGGIDISDLTYLVAFSFKGGPAPKVGEAWRE